MGKDIISCSGKRVGTAGDHSYGIENMIVREWGEGARLTIGKYCSIARGVLVLLGGNHRPDWVTTFPFGHTGPFPVPVAGHPATNGDVNIGNDVWIGTNATIMSGVTVCDGSVVDANAHVVKDVSPYSIVGGNPARHIKFRFEDEIVRELLDIKWWDWNDRTVADNVSLLCSSDVRRFVDKYKKN